MALKSIVYKGHHLSIINQLLLPFETQFIELKNTEDAWESINRMQVRGAPAIAIVGCLSLAVELRHKTFESCAELSDYVCEKLAYLVTARPTAVNMWDTAKVLSDTTRALALEEENVSSMKHKIISEIERLADDDLNANYLLAKNGADALLEQSNGEAVTILTHCNTGSLASAGYGTALGVVRALHERKKLNHVYFTETRPYNQGSRLTAYELLHEKIPATLICDSMVAALMQHKQVSAVVVGADRVVINGDLANKIGTLQLAIAAKYFNIPFYVAATEYSFDVSHKTGASIVIEERPSDEMTSVKGIRISAPGVNCWNPAFDVTPADLITTVITEFGVFPPSQVKKKLVEIQKLHHHHL